MYKIVNMYMYTIPHTAYCSFLSFLKLSFTISPSPPMLVCYTHISHASVFILYGLELCHLYTGAAQCSDAVWSGELDEGCQPRAWENTVSGVCVCVCGCEEVDMVMVCVVLVCV